MNAVIIPNYQWKRISERDFKFPELLQAILVYNGKSFLIFNNIDRINLYAKLRMKRIEVESPLVFLPWEAHSKGWSSLKQVAAGAAVMALVTSP